MADKTLKEKYAEACDAWTRCGYQILPFNEWLRIYKEVTKNG